MGAWRGGRGAHLGDRCGRLPGRDRRRLHRLPLPAELRLAVDRQRGQGRAQLGRDRRLLQRRQLRPDVHVPRDPAAACVVVALVVWHVLLVRRHGVVPPYPAKRRGRSRASAGRRAREPRSERDRARGSRPDESHLAGPVRPLRPDQGVRRRARRGHAAGGRPHHPLLLPRRPADDDPELGAGRPERLRRHRGYRAGRHERASPTYGPPYNHTPGAGQKIGPLDLQSAPGVRIPIDTAEGLRARTAERASRETRALKRALAGYQAAPPALQEAWTGAYEEGRSNTPVPRRDPISCPPVTTGRSRR